MYLVDYNEPSIGLTGKLLIFINLSPGHKKFSLFLVGISLQLGVLYLIVLLLVFTAVMKDVVTRQRSVT